MAQIQPQQFFLQLPGVDQITVVRQYQTKRQIDVKRLRFSGIGRRSSSRVAAMGDAHVPRQRPHINRVEHLAHQPGTFVHVEDIALGGRHARRFLTAMLQNHQPVVEQLTDRFCCDNANNAAHG